MSPYTYVMRLSIGTHEFGVKEVGKGVMTPKKDGGIDELLESSYSEYLL